MLIEKQYNKLTLINIHYESIHKHSFLINLLEKNFSLTTELPVAGCVFNIKTKKLKIFTNMKIRIDVVS